MTVYSEAKQINCFRCLFNPNFDLLGSTKSVSFVVRISLENQEDIRERSSAGKFHAFYLLAGNVATGETYLKAKYEYVFDSSKLSKKGFYTPPPHLPKTCNRLLYCILKIARHLYCVLKKALKSRPKKVAKRQQKRREKRQQKKAGKKTTKKVGKRDQKRRGKRQQKAAKKFIPEPVLLLSWNRSCFSFVFVSVSQSS